MVNIGRKVYDHLPEDSKFEQVVAPDMSDLSSVKLPHEAYDIAFCTLGTTRADAGSDAAFKCVQSSSLLTLFTFWSGLFGIVFLNDALGQSFVASQSFYVTRLKTNCSRLPTSSF